jgi:hypothetical protein
VVELTDEQLRAIATPSETPPRLVNPRTHETFVLLPADEYERLRGDRCDAPRPTTGDERNALARNAAEPPAARGESRRFGTLKGSVVAVAPDFDDVPQGFEDYLP